jgi:hypothetical protein
MADTLTRPKLELLQRYSGFTPLVAFLASGSLPIGLTATMSVGQWEVFHEAVYDVGGILLEVNDAECVVATYQKRDADARSA